MKSRSTLSLLALLFLAACDGCDARLAQTFTAAVPAAESVAFGEVWVGTTARHEFKVQNLGSGTLTMTRLELEGDAGFAIEGGSSTSRLDGGGALVINLAFSPTVEGPGTAVLVLDSDADSGATLRVNVTGTGIAQPDCDDANTCTTDTFDPLRGECVQSNRTGTCDADNACVTDSECVEGRCIGVGVACSDDNPCTRDLCDATSGCVSFDDPDACDDDNPCTVDRCDPVTGCSSLRAPDGTPCAPAEGCTTVFACLAGQCRGFPVPDGSPCDDGNVCTTGDHCAAGSCQGARETTPPHEVARLNTYGSRWAMAVILPDERIVFAEWEGSISAYSPFHMPLPGPRLTLVRATASGLERLDELVLEPLAQAGSLRLERLDDQHVVVEEGTDEGISLRTVRVEQDRLVMDLTTPFQAPYSWLRCTGDCAGLDGRMYACGSGSNLHVLTLAGPDAPSATTLTIEGNCNHAWIDSARGRLLVDANIDGDEVWHFYDLADPIAPSLLETRPSSGSTAGFDDGRVAFWSTTSGNTRALHHLDTTAGTTTGPLHTTAGPVRDAVLTDGRVWYLAYPGLGWVDGALNVIDTAGEEVGRAEVWAHPYEDEPDWTDPARELVARGSLAVILGTRHFGARVLRLGGEGDERRLAPLTGVGHGRIGRLVAGEAGVTTVATDTILRFRAQGAASQWDVGGMLDQPTGLVRVRGLAGTVDVPVTLPEPYRETSTRPLATTPNPTAPVTWTDALVPDRPVVRGSLTFATEQWLESGAAGPLVALAWPTNGTARLLEYGLGDVEPSFGLTPPIEHALSLEPVAPGRLSGTLRPSRDGQTVALATWHPVVDARPEHPTRIEVHGRTPQGFALIGTATMVGSPQVSFEDGLLVLLDDDGTLAVLDPPLEEGGEFVERARLWFPSRSTLLGHEGRHAFVGAGDRMQVVELAPVLRVLGETIGFAAARSLAVVDDHLYLATPTTISVIHPPCPAP